MTPTFHHVIPNVLGVLVLRGLAEKEKPVAETEKVVLSSISSAWRKSEVI